jgi:hypothetical protein
LGGAGVGHWAEDALVARCAASGVVRLANRDGVLWVLGEDGLSTLAR